MQHFILKDVIDLSAHDLWYKRFLMKKHFHSYSTYDQLERILENDNKTLIQIVAKKLFDGNCHIGVWDEIERPYSKDSIMFANDIVTDDGKIAMLCRGKIEEGNEVKLHEILLEAAVNCFMTTQSANMLYFRDRDYVDELPIDDNFKYLVLIGNDLYEITLTSPSVLWMYISHKLEMSTSKDTALSFDNSHPQEHKFNMLKCAFTWEKIN